MDATVIATFACAVLAAAGTGVLVGRCIRVPRIDIIAWACAVAAIAVSLGAQAVGAHNGYASATFRVVQLCAQLIAPLWLAWGMVELGGRSIAARFGAKLVTAALTVIGAVVLITDPLGGSPFSKSWPVATQHYQIIPKYLLEVIAVVTVLTVVIMLIVALVRLRSDPAWRRPVIALAEAGAAAVAILGLRLNLQENLAYPALCAVCAALVCFAGMSAVKVRLDQLHGEIYDDASVDRGGLLVDDTDDRALGMGYPRRAENGATPRFGDTDWYRLGRSQSNGGYSPGGGYPPDGGYAMNGRGNGDRDDRLGAGRDGGFPHDDRDDFAAGPSDADRSGVWQPRTLGRAAGLGGAGPSAPGPEAGIGGAGERAVTQRLFGLIAIYTLAEGKAEDFDALAERVVEEVRSSEPDALVYAVHSVPNAPMQRIFYEVYRDQTAYEEHKRQSYIKRFDDDRAPFVLATNVIELGTQQAKLTSLPGLSQVFGHARSE
jgi:quinol monooxygenase YgiN